MLNISLNSLLVQRSVSQSPFFQQRSFSFKLSNSEFSRFAAPLSFRSLFTTVVNTRLSNAINGAIIYDGNIQHAAVGNPIKQEKDTFSAFNCHFINCHSNENGGAFLSPTKRQVVTFERCQFTKCTSEKDGGAIYVTDGVFQAVDCSFIECYANSAAQALFCYGEPKYVVNLKQVSTVLCPYKTPFAQGASMVLSRGDQYMRDINVTDSLVGGGYCGFKSLQPTEYTGKNIYVAKSTGTAAILITNNKYRFDPLVISNVALINNTCYGEDIIESDTKLTVKDSILIGNYFVPKVVTTQKPRKTPIKFNIGNKKQTVKATPTPTKVINIKYENAAYGEGHPYLAMKKACKKCSTINGEYTVFPIKDPLTPGIKKQTPISEKSPFNINIIILAPFACFVFLLISIVLTTTEFQPIPEYSSEE